MASLPSLPEELKSINPYLQRAQETRKKEPIISYYCYLYAVNLAVEKKTKGKDSKVFLARLLDILEQDKKEHSEILTNEVAGQAYVENFALKVFTRADNEDRAGKATRITAKTFLAASLYIEILKLFGDTDPEFENKMKYAKWKAVDITKAFKEGRTPAPGPPGGEPDLQQQKSEENNHNVQNVNSLFDNDPFPFFPTSSSSAATTTEPPPSSDNDPFPLFPPAPTQDQPKPSSDNSVTGTFPNIQNLVSSFDQIDIIRNQAPPPPLPPKVNDYAGNNNNLSDYQFIQQPSSTPNFSPSPSANQLNFYDIHQNHKQPPPPQPPSSLPHVNFTNDAQPQQPHPSSLPHVNFTNDAQPQQPQQPQLQPQQPQPQQPPLHPSHNSFVPHPQALPQNYIQPTNLVSPPPHQSPSFSVPGPYPPSQQNYAYSQPPQAEIDPATVTSVQKYCKYASSALDYNDVKTAVDYMNKALEALKPYNR